jgi:hypothetical protein
MKKVFSALPPRSPRLSPVTSHKSFIFSEGCGQNTRQVCILPAPIRKLPRPKNIDIGRCEGSAVSPVLYPSSAVPVQASSASGTASRLTSHR